MLSIKKSNLLLFSITALGFFISYLLSPYHYGGDQAHYTRVYDDIFGLDLLAANIAYISIIDSKEIIHFIVIWIGSNLGISKLLLMSAANALLYFLLMKLFLSMRVSGLVALFVILTNYYIFTLFFTLEKLKFAIIFILIAILMMRKGKFYSGYLFASVLSHFQALIFPISFFAASIASRSGVKISKSIYVLFFYLLSLSFFVSIGYFFRDQILSKFSYYATGSVYESVENVIRAIFFMILTLIMSKNRKQTYFLFAPLIVMIAFVGGDRLNMIAYFFFLFYALQYHAGVSYILLLTSLYMLIKSILYIYGFYLSGG